MILSISMTKYQKLILLPFVLIFLMNSIGKGNDTNQFDKIQGFFDPKEKKLWVVNNSTKGLLLNFPASVFSIKGHSDSNVIDIRSISSRESWFLTSVVGIRPVKEDAVTINDIEDTNKFVASKILITARIYTQKDSGFVVGDSFNLYIPITKGTYDDLKSSNLTIIRINQTETEKLSPQNDNEPQGDKARERSRSR